MPSLVASLYWNLGHSIASCIQPGSLQGEPAGNQGISERDYRMFSPTS